jgi:hypothetical protein
VSCDRRTPLALLLALGLAVVLAACQPLPRPFEDAAKADNELVQVANRTGVFVMPIEGAGNPAGLAEAIAEALRRLEVPATSRAGTGTNTLRLTGKAESTPREAGRDQVTIGWRLLRADGGVAAGRPGSWLVPREAWEQGDPATLAAVAALAAPDLSEMIEGDRPVTQSGPPIVVWSVDGAPGDGAVTLKLAVERALRRAGYRVLPELGEDALVLSGAVTLSPAGAGRQRITIVWSVLASDGAELGEVTQENMIRAGLLDGPWGELARTIATAAMEGIGEVIDQQRRPG